MKRKLLRLARTQYWVFPASTTHLQESAASDNRAAAMKELRLLERLAYGRLLRDCSDTEALAVAYAFLCYLDGTPSEKPPAAIAYNLPDPQCIYSVLPKMLTFSYGSYRKAHTEAAETVQDATHHLFNQGWGDRFISRKETMRVEHAKHVELLMNDLHALAISDTPNESNLQTLKLPQTSTRLAQTCILKGLPLSDAIDFVRSAHFERVAVVRLHNLLYAFLQESAATAVAQGASRLDWAYKHRNDLVDFSFIAAYYNCVTDLYVDNFCGELLKKTEVRDIVRGIRVWTPKDNEAFEQAVDSALGDPAFRLQEKAFKSAVASDLSRKAQSDTNVMRADTRRKLSTM